MRATLMQSIYPKLKFYENKKLDYWTPEAFLTFRDEEDNFSEAILAYHPELSTLKNEPNENWPVKIKEYVNAFYDGHDKEIKEALKVAETGWKGISPAFYKAVDAVFKDHPWPKGEYAGFISIFNCNPRFLDNKTFQVFYKHPDDIKQIAAHEMLHFMFFDYAFKHFPKLTEENLRLTSELFNDVILALPEFVAITGNSIPDPYPSHEKLVPEFKALWTKSPVVKDFISASLEKHS